MTALINLSPRQAEILALVAEGLTGRQIATRCGCKLSTVHQHIIEIYNRLGAVNRAHAVAIAYQRRILHADHDDYSAPEFATCAHCGDAFTPADLEDGLCAGCTDDPNAEMAGP